MSTNTAKTEKMLTPAPLVFLRLSSIDTTNQQQQKIARQKGKQTQTIIINKYTYTYTYTKSRNSYSH